MQNSQDPHANQPPSGEDVVFFSPEMMRLAQEQKQRREAQLESLTEAAEQGDSQALVQMGMNCLYGLSGTPEDHDKAYAWFSQLPEDDPVGQYWLAVCASAGAGTDRNFSRAAALFRASAEQDYAPAQCDLGIFYENGIGVDKDLPKAVEL